MKTKNLACTLVPAILLSCALTPARAQPVVHVDANATGPTHDGSSWCSAYTALDDALLA
ncbi:MAG: hypothetical protein GTO03_00420, partial [Planctomycetales bacterium]|nr:hypothetical protein [Planctomycetales bacterium]